MATADGSNDGKDPGDGGLSRRDALRRFGIAAGVAWTAPVVMSFYSPAGAQTVGSPAPTTTSSTEPPNFECIGGTCGEFPSCSSANLDCVCVSTLDGLGLCAPGALACVDLTECGADGACPPGTKCGLDTCCGTPVCVPVASAGECPPDPAFGSQRGVRVSTGAGTVGG